MSKDMSNELPKKKKKFIINSSKIVLSHEESEIIVYKAQLTQMEKIVLHIAESHLETSFNIMKSIGFLEWKRNQSIKHNP